MRRAEVDERVDFFINRLPIRRCKSGREEFVAHIRQIIAPFTHRRRRASNGRAHARRALDAIGDSLRHLHHRRTVAAADVEQAIANLFARER